MARIEHTVEVDCPVATVWDLWSDVRRLPELSDVTTDVQDAPRRLTEVGQRFRQQVRVKGRTRSIEWQVTSVRPEDHLTIESAPAVGTGVTLTEAVLPLGEDHTALRLTISYRLPFGPLGHLADKLGLEQIADREAQAILQRVADLACRSQRDSPSHTSS